jgi:transposase InsO family protein
MFKTEAMEPGSRFRTGPLRTIDDIEYTRMEWVDWYNARRLHSQLNYIPPDEYETAYYAQTLSSQPATSQP